MPLASPNAILAELEELVHQITPVTQKRANLFAIFDVDGTLLNPFPRQLAIYEEILKPRFHLPAAHLLDLREKPYFIGDCIPELYENEERYTKSTQVFVEHFLSTEFLDRDQPYPGSISFVEAVRALGLGVIYLTSRHLNGPSAMADKTIEQLGIGDFPSVQAQRYYLLLKMKSLMMTWYSSKNSWKNSRQINSRNACLLWTMKQRCV